MNSDEAIDKALEGSLPNHEWQVLMSDHTTLKELEQHLGMDALLRVMLEKNDTSAALSDAIAASVKTSSVDDLMRGIEAATIGRRQRRWLTVCPTGPRLSQRSSSVCSVARWHGQICFCGSTLAPPWPSAPANTSSCTATSSRSRQHLNWW